MIFFLWGTLLAHLYIERSVMFRYIKIISDYNVLSHKD